MFDHLRSKNPGLNEMIISRNLTLKKDFNHCI